MPGRRVAARAMSPRAWASGLERVVEELGQHNAHRAVGGGDADGKVLDGGGAALGAGAVGGGAEQHDGLGEIGAGEGLHADEGAAREAGDDDAAVAGGVQGLQAGDELGFALGQRVLAGVRSRRQTSQFRAAMRPVQAGAGWPSGLLSGGYWPGLTPPWSQTSAPVALAGPRCG
jgi:hypothetical protein